MRGEERRSTEGDPLLRDVCLDTGVADEGDDVLLRMSQRVLCSHRETQRERRRRRGMIRGKEGREREREDRPLMDWEVKGRPEVSLSAEGPPPTPEADRGVSEVLLAKSPNHSIFSHIGYGERVREREGREGMREREEERRDLPVRRQHGIGSSLLSLCACLEPQRTGHRVQRNRAWP
jgi:hypothetical protein